MKKLTVKQQMFVNEYLVDLNATQAALRAGYSKKTAAFIGAENLKKPQIQSAIEDAMTERSERVELQADEVLMDLKRIIMFNPKSLYDENGNLKSIKDLDDDTALVLSGLKIKTESDGKQYVEIKWADKLKAIETAMRHLGMFNDKLSFNVMSHEDALAELE